MSMRPIIGAPILNVNRRADYLLRENVGMTIGTRIKEERRRRNLTQKKLADLAGMSQSALAELETGDSQNTFYAASLASALEVNALWLETGKGPRVPEPAPATNVTRLERLDSEESELIQRYRNASAAKRMTILAASEADEAFGAEGGADVTGH